MGEEVIDIIKVFQWSNCKDIENAIVVIFEEMKGIRFHRVKSTFENVDGRGQQNWQPLQAVNIIC